MVTTNHADFAAKIKMNGLHGTSQDAWKRLSDEGYRHYDVLFPGGKYNMTDLQAALRIHQLARLTQGAKRRQEIWARYDQAFADLPVIRPAPIEAGTVHARHLYTILVKTEELARTRDWVLDELLHLKIGTGAHYTALHLHPYYRQTLGRRPGDFPNAEYIGARTLSLPLSAKVVAAVREVTRRPG